MVTHIISGNIETAQSDYENDLKLPYTSNKVQQPLHKTNEELGLVGFQLDPNNNLPDTGKEADTTDGIKKTNNQEPFNQDASNLLLNENYHLPGIEKDADTSLYPTSEGSKKMSNKGQSNKVASNLLLEENYHPPVTEKEADKSLYHSSDGKKNTNNQEQSSKAPSSLLLNQNYLNDLDSPISSMESENPEDPEDLEMELGNKGINYKIFAMFKDYFSSI